MTLRRTEWPLVAFMTTRQGADLGCSSGVSGEAKEVFATYRFGVVAGCVLVLYSRLAVDSWVSGKNDLRVVLI